MPGETTLTPEEQQFFETGELPASLAPTPDVPDPLALAALGKSPDPEPPTPDPVVKPEPPAPDQPHTVSEAAAILARQLEQAQTRVGQLEQFIQQQKPAEPSVKEEPGPDPNTDPLGAMLHQIDAMNKRVLELQTQLQTQQTTQTQAQQLAAFQQQVRALKDEFVKTTPDFADAYTHLRSGRVADLKALGYTDQQANQAIFGEEAALSEAAIRAGKNPAEVIYEMSKRHGYTPKAATPAAPQTPEAKLKAVAAAQNASKQLPKSPVVDDITVEGLKEASDSDLNRLVMDPKVWAKIVGSDQYPL